MVAFQFQTLVEAVTTKGGINMVYTVDWRRYSLTSGNLSCLLRCHQAKFIYILLFGLPMVEIPKAVIVSDASWEVPNMSSKRAMSFFWSQKIMSQDISTWNKVSKHLECSHAYTKAPAIKPWGFYLSSSLLTEMNTFL